MYSIEYKGVSIILEKNKNGKFIKPSVAQFCNTGLSVSWFDDCRIPYESEDDMIPQLRDDKRVVDSKGMYGGNSYNENKTKAIIGGDKSGRFPANLLVSSALDINLGKPIMPRGDSGDFSRYFSLDKWDVENRIDNRGINSRKHYFNNRYFESIDTIEKAYWLGFIAGDGWIGLNREKGDYRLQINLQAGDKLHLYKFISAIDGDIDSIKIHRDVATLVLSNKEMIEDLIKYLPYKDKSFTLKIPNIKEELLSGFWSGLFDADGCICESGCGSISLVGTKDICEGFSEFLGFNKDNVYNKANVYQFGKSIKGTIELIYNKLYKQEYNFYLVRKREKFINLKYGIDKEQNMFETQFCITPKASKSEKNKGCDELEEKQMYKCDNTGNSLEIFGTTDGGRSPRSNFHPTVKPVKLMAYLITMFTRKGDVVVDPFMGSGTTGVACKELEREFIGCELSEEYMEIAKARIENEHISVDNKPKVKYNKPNKNQETMF